MYQEQRLIRAQRLLSACATFAQWLPRLPAETAMRVQSLRAGQQLGFTRAAINDRVAASWDAADPCPALAQMLAVKLHEIDSCIAALQALRQTLAERVAADCALQVTTIG